MDKVLLDLSQNRFDRWKVNSVSHFLFHPTKKASKYSRAKKRGVFNEVIATVTLSLILPNHVVPHYYLFEDQTLEHLIQKYSLQHLCLSDERFLLHTQKQMLVVLMI